MAHKAVKATKLPSTRAAEHALTAQAVASQVNSHIALASRLGSQKITDVESHARVLHMRTLVDEMRYGLMLPTEELDLARRACKMLRQVGPPMKSQRVLVDGSERAV
mmetsp:Transcript_17785/g.53671  ORF Transcript_17785/g.53671 Transcript_17785/m.53671 type:complete len:107 (-) Transcript_17785:304-624(-)|eukprot:scaffold308633_cov35-Tisochrysis_lutea.AAC.2